eukprot:gene5419-10845_t
MMMPQSRHPKDARTHPAIGEECQGIVLSWHNHRKYGFIITNFGTVFLHRLEWMDPTTIPSQGQNVIFRLGENRTGWSAIGCAPLQYPIPQNIPLKVAPDPNIANESESYFMSCNMTSAASAVALLEDVTSSESQLCKSKLTFYNTMKTEILTPSSPVFEVATVCNNTMEIFTARQRQAICEDLTSNTKKDGGVNAGVVVANNLQAYDYLMAIPVPLALHTLQKTHELLTVGLLDSAGQLRSTKDARCGTVRFMPAKMVSKALTMFLDKLNDIVIPRSDLSPQAKAAWTAYYLCAIHPFDDSNGRLSRLLGNWVLRVCGVPFPISLCNTPDMRKVARIAAAWTEFDRLYGDAMKSILFDKSTHEAKIEKAIISARVELRASACMICFEDTSEVSMLCCGKAIHLNCINKWLQSCFKSYLPRQCPNCRDDLMGVEDLFRPQSHSQSHRDATGPFVGHYYSDPGDSDSDSMPMPHVMGVHEEDEDTTTTTANMSATGDSPPTSPSPPVMNNFLRYAHGVTGDNEVVYDDTDTTTTTTTINPNIPSPYHFGLEYTLDFEDNTSTSTYPPRPAVCMLCTNQAARDCPNYCCRGCCIENYRGDDTCPRHCS